MPLRPRALPGAALLTLTLATTLAAAAPSGPARWTEWHAKGDDVTITVDGAGLARIEHALPYRVVMGPLRQIELAGLEKSARLIPEASVISEEGHETPAHVELKSEGIVRVLVDEPKGLKRGSYTFRVRYDVDLVAAKELVPDGALWRLTWRSPPAPEGYDVPRVRLILPAAQTEPRAVKTGLTAEGAAAEEGGEDGVTSTLRREKDRDELELLRPHVSRGEAAIWAARVDPKAFPGVSAPELHRAPPPPPPEPNRLRELSWGAGLAVLGLAFGLLVGSKRRAVEAACLRAGVLPAPLVRGGPALAGALAGGLLAAGVALQAFARPTLGAALVAAAMALGVSTTPAWRRAPRGPGRWLPLRPGEAFAARGPATGPLDVGTPSGRLALIAAVVGVGALSLASRALAPEAPYLVALDALALVPLFATGRGAQLPPDPARSPAGWLQGAFAALAKDRTLKVSPWARVPLGTDQADELRLMVLPRASLPGLVGVELALAWTRTTTGWSARPEVLVRVRDGSAAAVKVTRLAPFGRLVPGKSAEEKVVVLEPRLPGRGAAVALVRRLAHDLTCRRLTLGGWKGADRRTAAEPTDRVPRAA